MNNLNAGLEQCFRAVAMALDGLPESEGMDFLARLTLILASELGDGERFQHAVQRALQARREGASA